MSHHRVVLAVLATLFTAGISSAASANCCGWGAAAPVAYAPVTYASAGCGGCGTPTAAVVYAQPVAPAPVVYGAWSGCGHCGGGLFTYAPAVEAIAIAPAPLYVVNQGPDYTGPGIMVPYHTWTPSASYVVPGSYPYGYGYHRYGYAHRPVYGHRYGYGVRYGYGARVGYGVRYGYGARVGYGVRYGYGVRRGYVGPRHVVYRGNMYGRPAMHRVYR
ncbi:MAG TPA: hypothetical protein VIJ04_22685 [Xanthobacteraceae bacterium]